MRAVKGREPEVSGLPGDGKILAGGYRIELLHIG